MKSLCCQNELRHSNGLWSSSGRPDLSSLPSETENFKHFQTRKDLQNFNGSIAEAKDNFNVSFILDWEYFHLQIAIAPKMKQD